MRFETRYDRWLVILLIVAAVCSLVPSFLPGAPGGVRLLAVAICAVVIVSTLPQYYEVRSDGLFIRQGWKKRLIPYASLAGLQSMVDWRSAGVFSSQRIAIATREGKRYLIAVAEEERFLEEVARRSPQLERKSFGLGTPFGSAPII